MKKGKNIQVAIFVIVVAVFAFTSIAFCDDSLVVDENGNVGIGVEAPVNRLHVYHPTENNVCKIESGDGTAAVQLKDSSGFVNVKNWGGNLFVDVDSGNIQNAFCVSTAGNVGIGTDSPSYRLHVDGGGVGVSNGNLSISNSSGGAVCSIDAAEDSAANVDFKEAGVTLFRVYSLPERPNHDEHDFRIKYVPDSDVIFTLTKDGDLDIDGDLTAASCCGSSDVRLKKEIHTCENALDKITRLRGVTFQWKDEKKGSDKNIGLIAQEVEKVFPEVVKTSEEDGYKSVAYANLVAPLIEAVKELKAENDALKARLDKLEGK